MKSSNHQITESLSVCGLEVILMILLLVANQGKVSRCSMVGLNKLPLRSLTKHLIVKKDVKLAPCRFKPAFMPFKLEWRKGKCDALSNRTGSVDLYLSCDT